MKNEKVVFGNTMVIKMGDPHDLTVICEACGMVFEAWNLERSGSGFKTSSWKRLS